MNLIELSNQLKDVPDQFLLKEVQAPSGAYPAYMVVTELTRRKRMRESAAKEMPETTVAEDLVGEQERARAMAQVQNQMEQAQPMIPSQESLNAPSMGAMGGLGALPEAQGSLAAQDAMGTTPPEMMMPVQGMAGGGMVSFKEGGEIPRFQVGGMPRFEDLQIYYAPDSGPASSMSELFGKLVPSDTTQRRIDPVTGEPVTIGEYMRRQEARQVAQARASATPGSSMQQRVAAQDQKFRDMLEGRTPITAAPAGQRFADVAPRAVVTDPSAATAVTPATASSPELARLKQLSAPITLPTEQELAARAATGETQFAEKVPYRFGFLEDQLKSEAEKLRGREQSNINEALIQAGLGIMGSKSPRFLGAVSEGGLAALRAYKEGQKDIRDSERALVQSRIKAAEAQSLYDKDKFAAGDKKRAQSLEYAKTAADLQNTESAAVARTLQGQVALSREAREAAESPSNIAYRQALARQADALASVKQAPTQPEVMMKRAELEKKNPGASNSQIEQMLSQYFASIQKVYTPQGVVGAQGTGAKFLGFEQ